MKRVEATPTPTVLVWARKTAGMSVDVAADKAGVKTEQLVSWESGVARPSLPQLRKLATVYRRPLAAFYLTDPPQRFEVMHDFRRLSATHGDLADSPKLSYEIRRAFDRREWALELMDGVEETPTIFSTQANVNEDVETVATRLRQALEVTVTQQGSWSTEHEAFRQWRNLLERSGVLTLQATSIQLEEARGFSISMKPLPVVVVNIKDSPRGRIFTLLHEVTHVMLNDGGICDLLDDESEIFCNRVAGASLFPREDVLASGTVRRHRKGDPEWTDEELMQLSRQFGGSREAALVRLLTLRLTSQSFYERARKEFVKLYDQQRRQKEEAEGFAPPHVIALTSAGPMFTSLVLENFFRDRITASDVSDYLQIRLKHVRELQSDFSREAMS